jgi:HD-like signal output (HDOD) protein
LDTTHAEIGAFLLRHWRLPDELAAGAESHHHPARSTDPMAGTVYLANQLAHAAGFSSMDAEPQPTLQDILAADETKAMCAAGSPPPGEVLTALAKRLNEDGENLSAQAAMLI